MLIDITSTRESKQRNMRGVVSQTLAEGIFIWAMLACTTPLLCAQEIRVKVLNGRNGKPVTNECLNLSVEAGHIGGLLAPTNNDGVVVVHFDNNQVTAEDATPSPCKGKAVLGPRQLPNGMDGITVSGDYYVACQEYGKIVPGEPATPTLRKELIPSYPIKKILRSGLSSSNTCGKFRAEPKPGELIFYVRPRSFLEKMRQ